MLTLEQQRVAVDIVEQLTKLASLAQENNLYSSFASLLETRLQVNLELAGKKMEDIK